jgi:hypothetical protein
MMKSWLTNATKKRLIGELRSILYEHPRYRSDSNNVVNKFSFKERPQRGVIISGTSGDRVGLSANDYIGRLTSFVMLTPYQDFPGTTLEWVRENFPLLEQYSKRREIFPSPPGAYLVEIQSLPNLTNNTPGKFVVKPYITVNGEPLLILSDPAGNEAQITNIPIYEGALRLWLNGRRPLLQDVDYSVDWENGTIVFLKDLPSDAVVEADYRYSLPERGPFDFNLEKTNVDAIPGAVIAFGDRAQDCDKMVVVVTDSRTEVAEVFGGKFEIHFDLTVFSRDAEDREKLSDYIIHRVLDKKLAWGYEGLELLDISPGGESEEIYNAEIDDYYYDSAVSLTIRVDWESYVSLPVQNFRIEQTSAVEEQAKGYADGSFVLDLLRMGDLTDMAGVSTTIGRKITFPRIK